MTLDQIALKYGTDKATHHRVGGQCYTPHYDRIFSGLRDQPIKLLEIGVFEGASIQMWKEYFPNASIFGLDCTVNTNEWTTLGTRDRYTMCQGDQSSKEMWAGFLAEHGRDWDIIIDDGGHYSMQVIVTFQCMWPALAPGGFYAIEDLEYSYIRNRDHVNSGWPSHMEFLKMKLDEINMGGDIDWAHFSEGLAILKKRIPI